MRRFLPLIAILCLLASPLACAFGEFRPPDPFNRPLSLEEAPQRTPKEAERFDAYLEHWRALTDALEGAARSP